jgi:hypothetical protein
MKFAFDILKLFGFMIACGILADYIRYFIIASHFSLYSIIAGVGFQIFVIWFMYKRFLE